MALTLEQEAILQEVVDARVGLESSERAFIAARDRYKTAIQAVLAELERVGYPGRVFLWQNNFFDLSDPNKPVIIAPPVIG